MRANAKEEEEDSLHICTVCVSDLWFCHVSRLATDIREMRVQLQGGVEGTDHQSAGSGSNLQPESGCSPSGRNSKRC
jgi:hypothetical protein